MNALTGEGGLDICNIVASSIGGFDMRRVLASLGSFFDALADADQKEQDVRDLREAIFLARQGYEETHYGMVLRHSRECCGAVDLMTTDTPQVSALAIDVTEKELRVRISNEKAERIIAESTAKLEAMGVPVEPEPSWFSELLAPST